MGGADDRVWNPGTLNQLFLGKLSAEIAAALQALGSDDRESDVMLDPGSHFRSREVLTCGFEKFHRGLIVKRWRVGRVDDHLAPESASARPSPVIVFTPVFGAAAILL